MIQAALFALSAVPVTRVAIDSCGRRSGICIGLAYGLSFGVQRAVRFDFHEIAFAMPLLARSMELLARRRWRAAAGWALPLLLVKEDQALTVAAIGVYVFCNGQRRIGGLIAGTAVTVGILSVFVVIPVFNPTHAYTYSHLAGPSMISPSLRLFTPTVKEKTVLALLAPMLFVALRSPLILLAIPLLAARFWASNPALWGSGFHYNAVLMPIIFIASIDSLTRLRVRNRGAARRLARIAPAAALIVSLSNTVFGNQPLRQLLNPVYWRASPQVKAAVSLLATIPRGAAVAASNRLAPQLTSRCRVFLFPNYPTIQLRPEWVAVADAPDPMFPIAAMTAAISALPQLGYKVMARGGGITLYRQQTPGGGRG